jgi:DNA-binding transcriptional ArsR family regulator
LQKTCLVSAPAMDQADAAALAKALGHPLRVALIATAREQGRLSAVGYERESEVTLSVVSYHARVLLEAGILAIAEEVPRRGAVEHRYDLGGPNAAAALRVLDVLAEL